MFVSGEVADICTEFTENTGVRKKVCHKLAFENNWKGLLSNKQNYKSISYH